MDRPQFDAIDDLLLRWADSYRGGQSLSTGYPAKASGGMIVSWRKDAEDAEEEFDRSICDQVDACVHSLQTPHRIAIYQQYNVGYTCFRFPDQSAVMELAKAEIEPLLRKRCLL